MMLLALSLDSSVNRQVWDFLLSGGTFMFFIVICSLVSAAIVIHRAMSLRREGVMPGKLVKILADAEPGQVDAGVVRDIATESESPLGAIVVAALGDGGRTRRNNDVDERARAAETIAREEVLRLQTGLSLLEDVITIAPLLGLLGTVSGLVGVFAELGSSGGENADPAVLASGIARALNTTIAGLAVAVPTVVARSYFTKTIETMAARMEVLVGRFIYASDRDVNFTSDGPTGMSETVTDAASNQGAPIAPAVVTPVGVAPGPAPSPITLPDTLSSVPPRAIAEPTVAPPAQPTPIPRKADGQEGGSAS